MFVSRKFLLSAMAALFCAATSFSSHSPVVEARSGATTGACQNDDSGLRLPAGFCATVFADNLGHARHLVVTPSGVVYVNTLTGDLYAANDKPPAGGFLIALQDKTGAGKATVQTRFGETVQSGGIGGTGIAIYKNYLYAENKDRILRYTLREGELVPQEPPVIILSGLPMDGDHNMHPFFISNDGYLYVDVGSASNACQLSNRETKSPGANPCPELPNRGGIWRYDANKTGQTLSPDGRYATGIRNGEGFAVDTTGHRIFVTQHGRDQLHSNWPAIYKLDQEATIPAEELVQLKQGGDYGWPTCYYDPAQKKLVLAPEYGGDGGHLVGPCANKIPPVAAFPAHWAPNAALFYDRTEFPSAYRDGVFIAFHGSWNRAPFAQGGYNVVFQSLEKPGRCEIFADGFAGVDRAPDKAEHRPGGLALGPDGALYVSDDTTGRIYRITYEKSAVSAAAAANFTPCPSAAMPAGEIVQANRRLSRSLDAGATTPAVPPGATGAMVARGDSIYHGHEGGASCTGCHGQSGAGSPLGPDLTDKQWLWSDGSYEGIAKTISEGVDKPKQYRSPMPPMGGSQLTNEQVQALAAYVWSLSH
jgi:glucose/arabinose dehydrogenase/mono/diheme cytochrome c family protein